MFWFFVRLFYSVFRHIDVCILIGFNFYVIENEFLTFFTTTPTKYFIKGIWQAFLTLNLRHYWLDVEFNL